MLTMVSYIFTASGKHIIESFGAGIGIIGREFPILCLSSITDEKTVTSTHRQQWLE